MITEAGESKFFRANVIVWVQILAGCCRPRKFQRPSGRKILLYWGKSQTFVLFRLFNWLDGSSPTLWRAICFIQSININVNFIQKHLHRNTQNNVWPNISIKTVYIWILYSFLSIMRSQYLVYITKGKKNVWFSLEKFYSHQQDLK